MYVSCDIYVPRSLPSILRTCISWHQIAKVLHQKQRASRKEQNLIDFKLYFFFVISKRTKQSGIEIVCRYDRDQSKCTKFHFIKSIVSHDCEKFSFLCQSLLEKYCLSTSKFCIGVGRRCGRREAKVSRLLPMVEKMGSLWILKGNKNKIVFETFEFVYTYFLSVFV